jgi:hypothetical protein
VYVILGLSTSDLTQRKLLIGEEGGQARPSPRILEKETKLKDIGNVPNIKKIKSNQKYSSILNTLERPSVNCLNVNL